MSDTNVEHHEHRGASTSLTIRVRIVDEPDMIGKVTSLIGSLQIDIQAIDGFRMVDGFGETDITVSPSSPKHGELLLESLKKLEGVEVVHVSDPTFLMHLHGKIEVTPRRPITNRDDLSRVYTPGVARVCLELKEHPEKAYNLTMKGDTILIVTDGSRILSLGNIGPIAGLPVMEGKAVLFKVFGNVNAVPICLATQDPQEIITTVKNIAPAYGGINLEDIASPGCWEVERKLQELLDIPVFHDDQHGTAVVVLAATINASKVVKKQLRHMRVVLSGVGAAGMACARLLIAAGVKHIVGFKKEGAVFAGRGDLNSEEAWLAANTRSWFKVSDKTTMQDALHGADMFLGLSVANILKPEDLQPMRRDPIVFALANPVAEVDPEGARKFARVIATGGSEFENQINNALVFPGIFRGALDARVPDITDEMKLAAARALAAVIPSNSLRPHNIIPSIFDSKAHEAVADAIRQCAHASGTARRIRRSR